MSSKLLFNKALIKKDFKILLPIFISNLLYLIIVYPFRYLQMIYNLKEHGDNIYHFNNVINSYRGPSIEADVFLYAFAIVAALLLFANEKGKKTIEILTAAPFSRKQIYINKIITGLLVIILPSIITFIITYFIIITNPMTSAIVNVVVLKSIFITIIIIQLLMLSYYIMISMLFGGTVSTFVCGTIITFIPAMPIYMFSMVFDTGYEFARKTEAITPIFILAKSLVFYQRNVKYLLLFSIIMLLAGYVLFKMYKMEKNSEFLTFKFTEPIFKIGFFICSALLCAIIMKAILYDIFDFENINIAIGLIIGAIFGYIVPKVVISRNKVA